jgi:fatty-acyl-CoA synthase
MTNTMMDVPLTIDLIVDRAERWMGDSEVVSRRPDKRITRTTYRSVMARARRLARALVGAGIAKGDRVATLMWNHTEHLEAYFGIPLAGAVSHTLNLRLHPDEIAYVANDARDRIVIVDDVLVPLLDKVIASGGKFERVLVVGDAGGREAYETFLDGAPDVELPVLAESDAMSMCYTSGTTGRSKGVVYSHRSTLLHALVGPHRDALDLSRADAILPVVPMFHVNAWGMPYMAPLVGAKLVFPGPHLDPASLLDLMATERVTCAAGVPTIWLGIREALDAAPDRWKLTPGLRMIVGGAAAPEQLIRDFDRLGVSLIHAWGMTEMSPIGLVSRLPPQLADADDATRYRIRAKQGTPPPLVDVRVCNEAGEVPRDDKTSGEVIARGPWVAGRYAGGETPERWTADGFFHTGDVARVDEHGFVQLTDRIADLIKSGGEWIASQELENHLMGHPAIREAAVVGVPHPRWIERPIAIYVLKPGATASTDELRAHLAARFPKFWLPDAFESIDALPRTSAGKFRKTELRERFRGYFTPK